MKPLLIGLAVILIGLPLLVVAEAFIAAQGAREDFTNPDRQPQTVGSAGAPLRYVVMGDSTAAGQGASTDQGIAPTTARELADNRQVTLINVAVSGATSQDVATDQLPTAVGAKPDLVLISVGANDVTKLTSPKTVRKNLDEAIDGLIASNCDVKIVLTGSPDMGGARRFAQPLRAIAGWRSAKLNRTIESLVAERSLTFAPIAKQTGPAFRERTDLLAEDRFHPNDTGYALWVATLNPALQSALNEQPSHCS